MQPFITETVAAIERRIDNLKTIRDSLVQMFGEEQPGIAGGPTTILPCLPAPSVATRKRMVKTIRKQKSAPAVTTNGNGHLTVAAAFRSVIAGFAGEFSNQSVRSAAIAKFPELTAKIELGTGPNLKFLAKHGEIQLLRKEGRNQIWKRLKKSGSATGNSPTNALDDLHKQIHAEIQKPNEG